MFRKIMDAIFHLIAAGALVWGVFQFLMVATTVSSYNLRDASAVQVTQVYSEATYYVASAAALFLLAILLEVVVYVGKADARQDNAEVVKTIEKTNDLLRQIGRVLTNRDR